jgi:hypothetical protein
MWEEGPVLKGLMTEGGTPEEEPTLEGGARPGVEAQECECDREEGGQEQLEACEGGQVLRY